jgi:hypothetical protein
VELSVVAIQQCGIGKARRDCKLNGRQLNLLAATEAVAVAVGYDDKIGHGVCGVRDDRVYLRLQGGVDRRPEAP